MAQEKQWWDFLLHLVPHLADKDRVYLVAAVSAGHLDVMRTVFDAAAVGTSGLWMPQETYLELLDRGWVTRSGVITPWPHHPGCFQFHFRRPHIPLRPAPFPVPTLFPSLPYRDD